jgi:metal-responsive CopG/Arc/MetJ family transcriptional regulator
VNNFIVIGVSLPKAIVTKIDYLRADVNRSRWILRALESLVETIENKKPYPGRKMVSSQVNPNMASVSTPVKGEYNVS